MAYGKVSETYWHDRKIRALSEDARFLMLYLLTCPHRNRIGLFTLDPYYAAGDMQWPVERVQAAMGELGTSGRIGWDQDVRVVFLPRWFAHNTLENENVAKGAKADLGALPDTHFLRDLLQIVTADGTGRKHWKPFLERLRERVAGLPHEQPKGPTNSGSDNSSANRLANGSANGSEDVAAEGIRNRYRNGLGNQPEQEQEYPAPCPAPAPSPEENKPHASPPVTAGGRAPGQHEHEVAEPEARRLRDQDREVILRDLHLGAETVEINGLSVGMKLEMHIRDELVKRWGARVVNQVLPWIRRAEEFGANEPISLRLLEARPEVMTRALAAAASDDAAGGPTPEQLGVRPKTMPTERHPNVLQAEAKRKLEEARRLA